MKKILTMLLVLSVILVPLSAFAEELVKLENSDAVDLDDDGSLDSVSLSIVPDEEDETFGHYTLTVNGLSAEGDGISLTGELYAGKLGYQGELLLVPEYGMSDDDCCHAYLFDGDRLIFVGDIPTSPSSVEISDNIITCSVRGKTLMTWFRPADYVLSFNYGSGRYPEIAPLIVEAPRASYPLGVTVTLKTEVSLKALPIPGAETVGTLAEGDTAVIASTDDANWIYLYPLSGEDEIRGGYVFIRDFDVFADEGRIGSWDVFDGLLFAD